MKFIRITTKSQTWDGSLQNHFQEFIRNWEDYCNPEKEGMTDDRGLYYKSWIDLNEELPVIELTLCQIPLSLPEEDEKLIIPYDVMEYIACQILPEVDTFEMYGTKYGLSATFRICREFDENLNLVKQIIEITCNFKEI